MFNNFIDFLVNNKDVIGVVSALIAIVEIVFKPIQFNVNKFGKRFKNNSEIRKIYISAPISTTKLHKKYRNVISDICIDIKKRYPNAEIFSSYDDYVNANASKSNLNLPNVDAASVVLTEIYSCDAFILLLAESIPTSCFIEVGIAIGLKKKIAIFHTIDTLPWLLRSESASIFKECEIKYFPVFDISEAGDCLSRNIGEIF